VYLVIRYNHPRNRYAGVAYDAENNGKNIIKVDPKIAPLEYFLGIPGITGITAYVGLFKIGELREGQDTVFASSAAGGVGSVACQIAKIKGCHVVGSAGREDKVKWLFALTLDVH
jgi:NADPH-dependent curcumin reductase CurA